MDQQSEIETHHLSDGLAVTVVPAADGNEFSATLSSKALDQLVRVGEIPKELRHSMAEWLQLAACLMVSHPEAGSGWFTRRDLRNTLCRLLRDLKRGAVSEIDEWLLDEVRGIQLGSLAVVRLGLPWWMPVTSPHLEEFVSISREVEGRIQAARADRRQQIEMIESTIKALKRAPERTREQLARRGRMQHGSQLILVNAVTFWTNQLGRPTSVSHKLVAFVDVAFRICGIEKSERGVRAQLEDALARLR